MSKIIESAGILNATIDSSTIVQNSNTTNWEVLNSQISVVKTPMSAKIIPNVPNLVTVIAQNNTNNPATDVSFVDDFDDSIDYVTDSATINGVAVSGVTFAAGTLTIPIANGIPANGTIIIQYAIQSIL